MAPISKTAVKYQSTPPFCVVEQEIKNVGGGADVDCAAIDTQRNSERNRGPKNDGTFKWRILASVRRLIGSYFGSGHIICALLSRWPAICSF